MNWTARWLGVLLAGAIVTPLAHAQYPPPRWPGYPPPPRIAPDACGPGIYWPCPDGSSLGPSHYLQPPWQPFQGILPQVQKGPRGYMPMAPMLSNGNGGPQEACPSHPYARSPRDFFMWSEAQQDLHTRERRPALVP